MEKITLANLESAGLRVVSDMFACELKRAVQDVIDRPLDKKARKVVLELHMVPDLNEQGMADAARTQWTCSCSVPAQKTRVLSLGVHASGGLMFKPESPDDFRQRTMFDPEKGGDA